MLGKSVTDLQSDIEVGTNAITGELNYVTGYTGFSGDTTEQSGNYLAFHCASTDADTITVEIVGAVSTKGEQALDEDGIMVFRVTSNDQKIKVRAYKDGVVGNVQTYSITGLTLKGE